MVIIVVVLSIHTFTGSKKSGTKGVTSAKMLCEVERKVFFMLVWSKEHYSDLLPLQKVIEIEHGMYVLHMTTSLYVCGYSMWYTGIIHSFA